MSSSKARVGRRHTRSNQAARGCMSAIRTADICSTTLKTRNPAEFLVSLLLALVGSSAEMPPASGNPYEWRANISVAASMHPSQGLIVRAVAPTRMHRKSPRVLNGRHALGVRTLSATRPRKWRRASAASISFAFATLRHDQRDRWRIALSRHSERLAATRTDAGDFQGLFVVRSERIPMAGIAVRRFVAPETCCRLVDFARPAAERRSDVGAVTGEKRANDAGTVKSQFEAPPLHS